jgi:2-amino-4-hydroxy-6-hydroxymethyldihydropteridine diphosphokinase
VIGLGANLGDRVLGLARAALGLARVLEEPWRVSPLYETAPIGPEQPDYLNAAAVGMFRGRLEDLLEVLFSLEREGGRTRDLRWGPRTVDLDLLWAESETRNSPDLTVPHPRLRQRAFALRPLVDLVPDAIDPTDGLRYASLLPSIQQQRISEFHDDRWTKTFAVRIGARASGQG